MKLSISLWICLTVPSVIAGASSSLSSTATVCTSLAATEKMTLTSSTLILTLTVGEVVPSVEVSTQPVTVFKTITTTLYSVSTHFVPSMKTGSIFDCISTTTANETLHQVISTLTTTETLTSTTFCPTRTLNPTFTPQYPLPTEYTWGCPAGWLCGPSQDGCNFEVGLPDEGYLCPSLQCEPATDLGVPQLWDLTIYGNSSPATDPSLRINVIGNYFNMDPRPFGISYDVFVDDEVLAITTTIAFTPTSTVAARQAQTYIPGTCYPWCNDCLLEAQSVGKTPALCEADSAYQKDLKNCQQCIIYHQSDNSGTFVQIAPQFQQFMLYCENISSQSPTFMTTVLGTQESLPAGTIQPSSISLSHSTTAHVTATGGPHASSTTDWVVTSGKNTITWHSSPVVITQTQWIMTSGSFTMTFSQSPTVMTESVIDSSTLPTSTTVLSAAPSNTSGGPGTTASNFSNLVSGSTVSPSVSNFSGCAAGRDGFIQVGLLATILSLASGAFAI